MDTPPVSTHRRVRRPRVRPPSPTDRLARYLPVTVLVHMDAPDAVPRITFRFHDAALDLELDDDDVGLPHEARRDLIGIAGLVLLHTAEDLAADG